MVRTERDEITANEFGLCKVTFLSDVFVAAAVVDLKVPMSPLLI